MPIRFNAPHPTFFTWDQKIRKVSEMNSKWLSIALTSAVLVLLIGIVPASASPSEADTVHIVQRGETLSAIAVRYGVNMWTIASVNGITLSCCCQRHLPAAASMAMSLRTFSSHPHPVLARSISNQTAFSWR